MSFFEENIETLSVSIVEEILAGLTDLKFETGIAQKINLVAKINGISTPLNSFKDYIDNGGDQQSFLGTMGQGIVDWLDDTNNVWLVYNKNHIC
tara:strand:- start:870 stop:1151 length:282 start_codon:yes stop_codon:yes gene_type:complete